MEIGMRMMCMLEEKKPLLQLKNISKSFGEVSVIKDISLTINQGELITFIGPSGCGKTTLLRIIGGFHPQDSGEVLLEGQSIDHLPTEKRATGMVFQNYALFPHMTIYENVAYGLNFQKKSKNEKDDLVKEVLAQVRLSGFENRKPNELSGGQQQRVAIARCLVLKPKVLLLDEPLSNLDANLRTIMRDEIRRLKEELNLTIIFVTHDQEEALSISDRVLVINDGSLQQLNVPSVIYQNPANEFVANFVGHANLLTGRTHTEKNESFFSTDDFQFPIDSSLANSSEELQLLIRPEMIKIDPESNLLGEIVNAVYHGSYIRYQIQVGKQELILDDHNGFDGRLLSKGDSVGLRIPKKLHIIEREKELIFI
ncbi:ABC transporter ATP-binding protein [Sporosarcina sp. FA9]|uniref:ABC transporter ATP-binding protein n=1 Tax=Sporosarcina sp. FA9 TaxID=3413030 RepID=UPI003F65D12C